jgi:hypothetical protein
MYEAGFFAPEDHVPEIMLEHAFLLQKYFRSPKAGFFYLETLPKAVFSSLKVT